MLANIIQQYFHQGGVYFENFYAMRIKVLISLGQFFFTPQLLIRFQDLCWMLLVPDKSMGKLVDEWYLNYDAQIFLCRRK